MFQLLQSNIFSLSCQGGVPAYLVHAIPDSRASDMVIGTNVLQNSSLDSSSLDLLEGVTMSRSVNDRSKGFLSTCRCLQGSLFQFSHDASSPGIREHAFTYFSIFLAEGETNDTNSTSGGFFRWFTTNSTTSPYKNSITAPVSFEVNERDIMILQDRIIR
jgi:hypothetical protein